jgi:hypothetical protein
LAEQEWISSPKQRRDKDALYETAGPAPHGSLLLPPGGRSLGAHRGLNGYTALSIPVTKARG